MKLRLLYPLTLIFILSCRDTSITIPQTKIDKGQSLNYLIEIESDMVIEDQSVNEKIMTKGSYLQTFTYDDHLKLKIDLNDFVIEKNKEESIMDFSRVLENTKLIKFYDKKSNSISIHFYELNNKEIDYNYINNFLKNSISGSNLINGTESMFTTNSVLSQQGDELRIINKKRFKTRYRFSNGLEQIIKWSIKEITDESCILRGKGTIKYPKIGQLDHSLEGIVLIKEEIDLSTGQNIYSESTTAAYGLIMTKDLEEPISIKITNKYSSTRLDQP